MKKTQPSLHLDWNAFGACDRCGNTRSVGHSTLCPAKPLDYVTQTQCRAASTPPFESDRAIEDRAAKRATENQAWACLRCDKSAPRLDRRVLIVAHGAPRVLGGVREELGALPVCAFCAMVIMKALEAGTQLTPIVLPEPVAFEPLPSLGDDE